MDYQEDDLLEEHNAKDGTEDGADNVASQPINSEDDLLVKEIEELREEGALTGNENIDDEDLAY